MDLLAVAERLLSIRGMSVTARRDSLSRGEGDGADADSEGTCRGASSHRSDHWRTTVALEDALAEVRAWLVKDVHASCGAR